MHTPRTRRLVVQGTYTRLKCLTLPRAFNTRILSSFYAYTRSRAYMYINRNVIFTRHEPVTSIELYEYVIPYTLYVIRYTLYVPIHVFAV